VNFYKKYIFKSNISILRGYNNLKNSNNLNFILIVKHQFSLTKISLKKTFYFNFYFNDSYENIQNAIRQYLIFDTASYSLNKSILKYFSSDGIKFSHPLPKIYLNILKEKNVKINFFKSKILWCLYILKQIIKSYYIFFDLLFNSLLQKKMYNFVYFENLQERNISKNNGKEKNIINWYHEKFFKNENNIYVHSIRSINSKILNNDYQLNFQKHPFITYLEIRKLFLYILWFIVSNILIFYFLITGKWQYTLMFPEVIKKKYVKLLNKKNLALTYMFHNSSWIYRPLWTYDAENKGSKIIFYFYSTNIESFSINNNKKIQANCWNIMTWPNIFVWDNFQKSFILNSISFKSNILITGPIWFTDIEDSIPKSYSRTIALFDIQPLRDLIFQQLGMDYEYYIPDVINKFLIDIVEVATSLNFTILYKKKKVLGRNTHIKYTKLIKELLSCKNLIHVNSEISAFKLIEKSDITISIPFTSTSLIASSMNKPTVYYDPTGLLWKEDPARHNIQIISNKQELHIWLEKQI
jgi:polysaccharide biosynthesis PFTS motif protein